jgi:hypothetical protein
MMNAEFKELLEDVFENHTLMNGRDNHTINELLHVLRYDEKLNCLSGVNISICKADGGWVSIPSLDAFVNIKTLGIWFDDDSVEFESDEFEYDGVQKRFDNITVYEREEKED